MGKKKHETVNVTSKDIVILRFPSEWPVNEADLQAMMKTVRTAINQDSTIARRFVCMAKGMDIETLKEEQFIQIWKSKFGNESFKKANDENIEQMELFPEVTPDFSDIQPTGVEDVLADHLPKESGGSEVTLNEADDEGNSWKTIDEETYEKVKRGEL